MAPPHQLGFQAQAKDDGPSRYESQGAKTEFLTPGSMAPDRDHFSVYAQVYTSVHVHSCFVLLPVTTKQHQGDSQDSEQRFILINSLPPVVLLRLFVGLSASQGDLKEKLLWRKAQIIVEKQARQRGSGTGQARAGVRGSDFSVSGCGRSLGTQVWV